MFPTVSKLYLTPHKAHIQSEALTSFSHCGRRISGLAWWMDEYHLKNVQRPVCKTCLRVFELNLLKELSLVKRLKGN